MSAAEQRALRYYRKEQEARRALQERNEYLYEKARRQIDLRIRYYPKNMQRHYQFFVEELWRDMCREDLVRQTLIENQQLYLRLAQAYQARVPQGVAA